jgi:hypothetical protein
VRARWIGALAGAIVLVGMAAMGSASAQSDETVPPEPVTTVDNAPTSILATTTTKPPECKDLLQPAAVFVGTVTGTAGESARFAVAQMRSGQLPGTRVSINYGGDIRFVKVGRQYVVAAAIDPTSKQLTSKVRRPREEAPDDPCISHDLVYTRNLDGSAVDTGVFSGLSGKTWEIAWAFLLPTLIALGVLTVLVLFRRAGVGAFRLTLRRADRPPPASRQPDPGPPAAEPDYLVSRTPGPPGPRARR